MWHVMQKKEKNNIFQDPQIMSYGEIFSNPKNVYDDRKAYQISLKLFFSLEAFVIQILKLQFAKDNK